MDPTLIKMMSKFSGRAQGRHHPLPSLSATKTSAVPAEPWPTPVVAEATQHVGDAQASVAGMLAKEQIPVLFTLSRAEGESLGLKLAVDERGAWVICGLEPGGVAARNGKLNVGDRIVSINGKMLNETTSSSGELYPPSLTSVPLRVVSANPAAPRTGLGTSPRRLQSSASPRLFAVPPQQRLGDLKRSVQAIDELENDDVKEALKRALEVHAAEHQRIIDKLKATHAAELAAVRAELEAAQANLADAVGHHGVLSAKIVGLEYHMEAEKGDASERQAAAVAAREAEMTQKIRESFQVQVVRKAIQRELAMGFEAFAANARDAEVGRLRAEVAELRQTIDRSKGLNTGVDVS